jgi:hypothetical protein
VPEEEQECRVCGTKRKVSYLTWETLRREPTHMNKQTHKTLHVRNKNMAEGELLAATQAHHYHSFRSMHCATEIITRLCGKKFWDYKVSGFWPSSGNLKNSNNVMSIFSVILSAIHQRQNIF